MRVFSYRGAVMAENTPVEPDAVSTAEGSIKIRMPFCFNTPSKRSFFMSETCCASAGQADVTGCRFSLYPMSDDFIGIILGSVGKIDVSKVWSSTDHLSTVYRGRQRHVIDCARAAFVYSWKKDIHMTGEFTFSRGCPGDVDADSFMQADDKLCNSEAVSAGDFYTYAKISFYVFGAADYMEHIRYVVELAQKHGLKPKSAHYVTLLEGSANALFNYFDETLSYAHKNLSHYVLEATLSVNSPSVVKK
jgi:hypothetical protein